MSNLTKSNLLHEIFSNGRHYDGDIKDLIVDKKLLSNYQMFLDFEALKSLRSNIENKNTSENNITKFSTSLK
jgi:hypothetical protein